MILKPVNYQKWTVFWDLKLRLFVEFHTLLKITPHTPISKPGKYILDKKIRFNLLVCCEIGKKLLDVCLSWNQILIMQRKAGCWIFNRIVHSSEWLLQFIYPVLLFAVCLHDCGHLAQATNWTNSKIRLFLAHIIKLFNQDILRQNTQTCIDRDM